MDIKVGESADANAVRVEALALVALGAAGDYVTRHVGRGEKVVDNIKLETRTVFGQNERSRHVGGSSRVF